MLGRELTQADRDRIEQTVIAYGLTLRERETQAAAAKAQMIRLRAENAAAIRYAERAAADAYATQDSVFGSVLMLPAGQSRSPRSPPSRNCPSFSPSARPSIQSFVFRSPIGVSDAHVGLLAVSACLVQSFREPPSGRPGWAILYPN